MIAARVPPLALVAGSVAVVALVSLVVLAYWLHRGRGGNAGSLEREIERLTAAGEHEAAGDRRFAQGRIEAALALFTTAGAREKAARCHLALKQPEEAADLYARLGRLAEAAHYFQSAGAWSRAAECLHTQGSEREAAELYERAGELGRSAEVLRALGDQENAARLFERAGQPSDAAAALRAAHGGDRAAELRAARLFETGGDMVRAAEAYASAGEWLEAAERYVGVGEFQRAAQAFERANAHARAAESYERAGCAPEARLNYERAGDVQRAAEVSLRMGNALEAARGFYHVAAYERAIETLQGIESGSPDEREARLLLGRIFVEKGLYDRAKQPLGDLAVEPPRRREDLAVLMLLAEVHERSGEIDRAMRLYESIVEFDRHHEDASERLERLQEKAWGVSGAAPSDTRYVLEREIGRGGMGVVHLARDTELERRVAIKFLPSELASHTSAVDMFRAEAKAAAAMNHPNIVTVYDACVLEGRPAIVMEFVRGQTARQLMRVSGTKERRPVPPARVARIARDICEALSYAHTQNLIHRDVKPGNVIVDQTGRAKLMDFGISKVLQEGVEGLTQAKGTPQYMPPEQILGREIDGRTDLYALGISMFEIATTRRPFRGEDVVNQQLNRVLPDPHEANEDIPEALSRIIRRACEKRPADRFQSAREMSDALNAFLSDLEV